MTKKNFKYQNIVMCGIVAAVARKSIVDVLIEGLKKQEYLLEKLKFNLQEVWARGGELYVFADAGGRIEESDGVHILQLPEHYGVLSPVLHVVPLQLLSYHVALIKGTDVDKPRNLAKSVTIE